MQNFSELHTQSQRLVKIFYGLGVILTLSMLYEFQWVRQIEIVLGVFLLLSQVAVLLTKVFVVRLIYAIAILVVSYYNEYIDVSHADLLAVWLFIFLVFLPDNLKSLSSRYMYFLTIRCYQFLVLFIYSVTGFWKIFYGVTQWRSGEVSLFDSGVMKAHAYSEILRWSELGKFGEAILYKPQYFWLPYWGVVLAELLSLALFFTPRYHRIWAFVLLGIHISTWLFMDILFESMAIVAFVVMFYSPCDRSKHA